MTEVLPLTLGGWLSRGWRAFKRNPKPLIGGALILRAYSLVLTRVDFLLPSTLVRLPFEFVVTFVILPVLWVGWYFLCLRVVRGDKARISDIFAAFSRFGRAWLTYFLLLLITLGGLFLLVIPGIIWALKYGRSQYAVMDRNLSARESIRFSGKITKGHIGKLFGVGVITLLFFLLTMPFNYGLRYIYSGKDLGTILVAIGIVPSLLHVLVIMPWMGATGAAAYDSLAYGEETGETKDTSSDAA